MSDSSAAGRFFKFPSGSPRSENLRAIVDSLAEGVVVADSSGEFLLFNRAAEEMLGVGAVKSDPSGWSKSYGCYLPDKKTLYPTEQLPMVRAFRGEETTEALMYINNPANPAGLWLSLNARPLPSAACEGRCGVVVFRDVTDKMRSRDRINRLYSAIEQAADVIMITDSNGTIEYINPAFESVTGFSACEALGAQPSILKSGQHESSFYSDMWRKILRGEVYQGVIANRRKNGEIFYTQQTISPIKTASGRISHFVSVGKDITRLRKAEEQEAKMRFARAVQQRFYPSTSPEVSGFEISGAAYPADATGGDYFDYIAMPEGCSGIAVGDVSGHGFDSALLMSETRAYVRSLASADADVGRVLTAANRVMSKDIEENRFITLMLVRVDPATRTLVYASAGHETGFVLDRDGGVKSRLTSQGFPLGMMPDTVYEGSPPVAMEPGEIAVLLTDGVTEAEAVDGDMFSRERALEIIATHRHLPASEIVEHLYRAVRLFIHGHPQSDDVTVVVCKCADDGSVS